MDQAEREIVVPASPEETWEAITEPERLAAWLGEVAEVELRPGGELAIRTAEGERRGFVEEVEPPRRLVFWWGAEGEETSRVELELEPDPDGTRVRVVETWPMAVLDLPGVEVESWPGGGSPQMSASALSAVC